MNLELLGITPSMLGFAPNGGEKYPRACDLFRLLERPWQWLGIRGARSAQVQGSSLCTRTALGSELHPPEAELTSAGGWVRLGGVERADERLDGLAGRGAEHRDAAATLDEPRSPVPVQPRSAGLAEDPPQRSADHIEASPPAAQHHGDGAQRPHRVEEAALGEICRQQQHLQRGAAHEQLQRLDVYGFEAERRARIEQQDPFRAGGGRCQATRRVQPARRPAAGMLELGGVFGALGRPLERRKQDLLDGALQGANREALLELAVGGGLVEAVEGAQQARRRGRTAAALLSDLDGGRDAAGLVQRLAQRLDLGQLVLAVIARRAPRLRVAETPLPGAKRAGAHAEQLGGGAGADSAQRKTLSNSTGCDVARNPHQGFIAREGFCYVESGSCTKDFAPPEPTANLRPEALAAYVASSAASSR